MPVGRQTLTVTIYVGDFTQIHGYQRSQRGPQIISINGEGLEPCPAKEVPKYMLNHLRQIRSASLTIVATVAALSASAPSFARQTIDGWAPGSKFQVDPTFKEALNTGCRFGFAMAMLDFIETYPADPLTPLIQRSLIEFISEGLLPAMATNSFGHLGEISAEKSRARPYLSPRYYDSTAYAAGYILSRAAITLGRPEWLEPAFRQILWGVGLNPRGVSFCMGVGTKNAATRTLLTGVAGHENARIPGGVNKGFEFENGQSGLTEGYPMFSGIHDEPRDGFTPAGQEYWKVIGAYFLLGTAELQKAYDYFQPGRPANIPATQAKP